MNESCNNGLIYDYFNKNQPICFSKLLPTKDYEFGFAVDKILKEMEKEIKEKRKLDNLKKDKESSRRQSKSNRILGLLLFG